METVTPTKPTTLILGATPNPGRYANIAAKRLLRSDYPVMLVGVKQGGIDGQPILNGQPDPETEIDTVTLYVGPRHQTAYYDYLIRLSPRRIIFNPGTENPELVKLAREAGIEAVVACTLVMLSTGEY